MFKKIWAFVATILVVIAAVVSKAPLEILSATVIGILFVLSVAYKKNIAPLLGATLSVFYAVLSYQAGFYANAVMNLFVLVPLQLWGTWYWFKKKDEINTLNKSQISFVSVLTVIGIIISTFFAFKSGSKLPYLDGISSVLIITGTVLLTFKTKEQWYAWIPYNIIECLMWFFAMSLEPSVLAIFVMRVVFFLNSLIGYVEWNKGK